MGVDLERFWPLREAALPGCASDSVEPHPKPQRKSGLGLGLGFSGPGQPCRRPTHTLRVALSLSSRSASRVRRGRGPVTRLRSGKLFWNHGPQQSTFLSCLCIVPSLPRPVCLGGADEDKETVESAFP